MKDNVKNSTERKLRQINKLVYMLNLKLAEVNKPLHELHENDYKEYLSLLYEDMQIIEFDLSEFLKVFSKNHLKHKNKALCTECHQTKWQRFTHEYAKEINFEQVENWLIEHNHYEN